VLAGRANAVVDRDDHPSCSGPAPSTDIVVIAFFEKWDDVADFLFV